MFCFEDCILIIASYPKNLCYLNHLNNLIQKFKKIYFIYSENLEIKNFEEQLIFQNNKIMLMKVDNIGYDFMKYYLGIKEIKRNNESFKYLFIINDSFIIDNWHETVFNENIYSKIYENDITGMFESNYFKNHLQSYFFIMNNKISDLYFNYLANYNFKEIKNDEDKNNIIMDLEVNFNNSILNNSEYKYSPIINLKNIQDMYFQLNNKYTNIFLDKDIPTIKNDGFYNPSIFIAPFHKIYKSEYLNFKNFKIVFDNTFSFKERLNIYFHCYQPFIRYYNFFYNKIKYNFPLSSKYTDIDKIVDIKSIFKHYKINIKNFNFIKTGEQNIINHLAEQFGCKIEDIHYAIELIDFIKKYNDKDDFILYLKSTYFYKNPNHFTTIENLVIDIQKIQNISKNKKLVYTNNINSYDTFWDIDDNYKENDTDYIYISNVEDKNVCKNFSFIYCNLENYDNFHLNRLIKFNKTLFNCYDKIHYIDANVKIITHLNSLFNLLDENIDMILFSHPERKTINEELSVLLNNSNEHIKWSLQKDKIDELKNIYENQLLNKLYWLNIHLTNTKYNIFEDFQSMYYKYKLKRDQIYFGIIQDKYNIKIFNLDSNKKSNNKDIQTIDGDYGYIEWWSDKYCRPYGGTHI
jgi:hypothetical protein